MGGPEGPGTGLGVSHLDSGLGGFARLPCRGDRVQWGVANQRQTHGCLAKSVRSMGRLVPSGLAVGVDWLDARLRPEGTTMRRSATIAVAVVAALVVGVAAGATTATRFSDVSEDHYAAEAIEWAADAGIVFGKGDGTFDPTGALNRAQMVTILYRYHQKYGSLVANHSHSYVPEHSHGPSGSGGSTSHDCELTGPAWTFGTSYLRTGAGERWGFDNHVHSIRVQGSLLDDGLTSVLAVECEHE